MINDFVKVFDINNVKLFFGVLGVIGFFLWVPSIFRFVASFWRLKTSIFNFKVFLLRWNLSKEECGAINWTLLAKESEERINSKTIGQTILIKFIEVPEDLLSKLEPGLVMLASKGYVTNYSFTAYGGTNSPPYIQFVKISKFRDVFENSGKIIISNKFLTWLGNTLLSILQLLFQISWVAAILTAVLYWVLNSVLDTVSFTTQSWFQIKHPLSIWQTFCISYILIFILMGKKMFNQIVAPNIEVNKTEQSS